MISIDTNILIRLLTGDDKGQAVRAKRLFLDEHIYISKTVVFETEWVLRCAYTFPASVIADSFVKLLGQKNVTIEDAFHIAQAINCCKKGWLLPMLYTWSVRKIIPLRPLTKN